MTHAFHVPVQLGELLDEHALTREELARACRRHPDWVSARVEAGVIEVATPAAGSREWHFTGTTLVRARRIAQLEATFDADPYLAALTADLIEEVAQLRRRLAQRGGSAPDSA
jgi:chaperone modulatory protein CbpM